VGDYEPSAAADQSLVLLPGMGCTAALWSRLRLPTDVEVSSPVLTEDALDAQVDRLLDELPRRFALAGLSLGGIVAMALVRRAPERVTRLALLSTNPRAPTPAQCAGWRRLRGVLESTSARDVQTSLLPSLLSPAVIARRPDLVALTLAMADEVGESGFDRQLRLQSTRVDERPGLRHVRCPTLVLAAMGDRLSGVAKHQEIAERVRGSRLATIPDCGHLSTLEQPVAVSDELSSWLAA
jgi:pimeloyl-ACP methyl ester carboxylesterase